VCHRPAPHSLGTVHGGERGLTVGNILAVRVLVFAIGRVMLRARVRTSRVWSSSSIFGLAMFAQSVLAGYTLHTQSWKDFGRNKFQSAVASGIRVRHYSGDCVMQKLECNVECNVEAQ
jgi:hypothetical protein